MKSKKIKIAIAGVGNCASSLVQGIEYYRHPDSAEAAGLIHPDIGGYRIEDVEVVAAFDVDQRKVGRPLHEAVFARPNCTTVFQRELSKVSVTVQMGPVLDGIAGHMDRYPDDRAFRPSDTEPVDISKALKESGQSGNSPQKPGTN